MEEESVCVCLGTIEVIEDSSFYTTTKKATRNRSFFPVRASLTNRRKYGIIIIYRKSIENIGEGRNDKKAANEMS